MEVIKMAKICTKCGKELEEGVACSCTDYIVKEQVQYQESSAVTKALITPQQANDAKMYFISLVDILKKIIKYPNTEGARYAVSDDRKSALGLIGIQALLTTLFTIIAVAQLNPLLKALSFFGGNIKMPMIKIFILTFIASVVLSMALAGIILGISTLFKNKITFQTALCITSIRSVALIPVTLVACLLIFVNSGYGVMLFYAGNLAGICYMISAFPVTSTEDKNKVPLIMFISMILFAIISVIVMTKIAPQFLPDALKEASDLFGNPGNLFPGMLDELY